MERLIQADFHVIAQIGAAPRLLAPASAAKGIAEDRLEDVADVGEAFPSAKSAAAGPALLEGGMAITIIGGTLLRILEAIVSLVDLLEARLALGAARIAVRVELHRQLAIGAFQRRIIGGPLNLEQFVIVDFGRHGQSPRTFPSPPRGRR